MCICHADTDALDAIDLALQRKPGTNQYSEGLHNIQGQAPTGTSKSRALRKLRTDAPEIHTRVIAGEISPHAGMVEAGFRKRTATIPATVDGFVNCANCAVG
jgi:hypothetical protein